jgi:hypothetical protein
MFFYLNILAFSQIWLNLPVENRHIENNTKLPKRKHCEKNCFCWGGAAGGEFRNMETKYKKKP